jgi:hypothetical protein
MMRPPYVLVLAVLVSALVAGCGLTTYNVQIIKVHEMIQDMEAIELDDPERAGELPETGILVNNKTDTTIRVKVRRKKEQFIDVPPGGSATMALDPGQYHYNFGAAPVEEGKKSKEIYINLRGTKKVVGKILYIYDVVTKHEVVKEKELEELRSR